MDTADERMLSMVHALLEENTSSAWWDTLPDDVKNDLKESIIQVDNDQTLTAEEVNKRFPQWHLK